MRILVFIVALLFAVPTVAQTMRAQNEAGEALLLYDTPCENKTVMATVKKQAPNYDGTFQGGMYVDPKGKRSPMCWTLLPTFEIAIVHEDGEVGLLPLMAFSPMVEG